MAKKSHLEPKRSKDTHLAINTLSLTCIIGLLEKSVKRRTIEREKESLGRLRSKASPMQVCSLISNSTYRLITNYNQRMIRMASHELALCRQGRNPTLVNEGKPASSEETIQRVLILVLSIPLITVLPSNQTGHHSIFKSGIRNITAKCSNLTKTQCRKLTQLRRRDILL